MRRARSPSPDAIAAGRSIGWSGSGISLYGVSRTDIFTYSFSGILLSLVALSACYIPARRAIRVYPMAALRHK
ncbi:MAG TPA: hypothetical protein VMR90_14715 [Candidatus Cybelea sp.]|nr:hypothetical protein [Candidatus Cybelea sp.]